MKIKNCRLILYGCIIIVLIFLIGKMLGDKHPKAKSAFAKTGENISYSRRVARAHYKSDSKMGEQLGNSMYKHIKNKK